MFFPSLAIGTRNRGGLLSVSPSTLSAPTAGQAYSETVEADLGTAPYTFTLINGQLPQGLTLALDGSITGTAETEETAVFTIMAEDSMGVTGQRQYQLVVGPAQAQEYTTAGTFYWTAPLGVTSVSVVAVGAGGGGITMSSGGTASGGGGGGLGWRNNISVNPGQTYQVVVGTGGYGYGLDGGQGPDGGDSYFISPTIVKGGGGISGNWNIVGAGGGFVGDGGGYGGNPGTSGGGGGGAGGYLGNGGAGGTMAPGSAAATGSGGGGGGAGSNPPNQGNSGGGVGLYGIGADGQGGSMDTFSTLGAGGGGGSGGEGNKPTVDGGSVLVGGGLYGGGGPGQVNFFQNGQTASFGARGAVRIIWGPGRSFPYNAS